MSDVDDRYLRHRMIDWFDQDKVIECSTIVVGAGAVGNEVLKNLALLGAGRIHIVDFDTIESHNLTRSVLFSPDDIGRNKAEVAAESCGAIDPNIEITYSPQDFWHSVSFSYIRGATAVFACVDNFEARIQLNRLCRMARTDFYSIGINSRSVSVEQFLFSETIEGACYECGLPTSVYESINERYSCGWLLKAGYEEKKIPTTTITASLSAGIGISMLMNEIHQTQAEKFASRRYFMDVVSLNGTISTIQRSPQCIGCGDADPIAYFINASRKIGSGNSIPLASEMSGEIIFSEPILYKTYCKKCGVTKDYFESTRNLTDSLTFCSDCEEVSIEPIIHERSLVEDFFEEFEGKEVPCKFLEYRDENIRAVIEMED